MLRDYLAVARDTLSAQKEIYQVKEQRLRLAQQEYRQLNDAWRDKSTSQTSCEYRGETTDLMEPDLFYTEGLLWKRTREEVLVGSDSNTKHMLQHV